MVAHNCDGSMAALICSQIVDGYWKCPGCGGAVPVEMWATLASQNSGCCGWYYIGFSNTTPEQSEDMVVHLAPFQYKIKGNRVSVDESGHFNGMETMKYAVYTWAGVGMVGGDEEGSSS